MKHEIIFYPVGNGDCNLIRFSDGAKMLVDCNFTSEAENETSPKYDVFNDLVTYQFGKKFNLPFVDAFVLTHPDQDHCRGFATKFFLNNPHTSSPTQEDKDENRIVIGELWYSPRVFSEQTNELSEDAKAFKKEAERRMKLWKNNDANKNKDGNRIRIVGYFKDEKLSSLPDSVKSFPGDTVEHLNGTKRTQYRFFIHAPFKDDIEGNDRNCTSIVFQVRFDIDKTKDVGKLVLGGDAEWRVWKKIQENTTDENNLKWNIFEAPHHCSYTFFADTRDDEPEQSAIDFLALREGSGYIVSSSKLIKQNKDNPPCQKAKNRYIKSMDDDEDYFLCTTTKDAKGNEVYEPVKFEIVSEGVKPTESAQESTQEKKASASVPHYYG